MHPAQRRCATSADEEYAVGRAPCRTGASPPRTGSTPRTSAFLLALVFASLPAAAFAQDDEPIADGPPKTADIAAVERGFFLELDAGGNLFVTKMNGRSYGFGLITGLFAGFDITPFIALSFGVASIVATGSNDNPVRGDLFYLAPMAQLQVAFITTERDFFYAKGGIGFGFGLPDTVAGAEFGGGGVAFRGLLGYERYMRLRHFSLGIQAGVSGVTAPGVGIGISILPMIKYTF